MWRDKTYKEKINAVCCMAVRVTGIIFVGYIFLQGLFTICLIQRVEEKTYYISNNTVSQITGIVLFCILTYFFAGKGLSELIKRHGDTWFKLVFVLVLAALGIWLLMTRFWYFGDMEKVYQYAGMLNAGDFSGWLPGGYPYMWSQQNGLILFVSLLLRFFDKDTSYIVFYFINLFFYGVMTVSFYSSMKTLFKDRDIYIIQLLMLVLYFPYAFFITLLYGDVIGFSFGAAAAALLLKYLDTRRNVHIVLSCVCIIFAVIFKQNSLIIFVGASIMLIHDMAVGFNKKKLLSCAVYIILALIGFGLPKVIIEQAGGNKIDGGNSKWANIAMGLQECDKAPGWYNCYEEEVFAANNYDGDATAAEAKRELAERLKYFAQNPGYAWEFINKKLASEWNNPTFECFHIQNWRGSSIELSGFVKSIINDGGKLNIILIYILDICQSVVLFGVLMYLIGDDSQDLRRLFFIILFIGGFMFFTVWEAKCRYTVPFYLMLIPYAWPGY
ncbi:MAG: hypothetical protein LUG83_06320, partial [Lachnospiraceae bacterium]|nr:hypothetical protein [Lachnospiraceae bacterium]